MRIDRSSRVQPPDLGHPELNQWMGELIARTDEDDQLASQFLACEARIALRANNEWFDYWEMLDTQVRFIMNQMSGPAGDDDQAPLAEHEEYSMTSHYYMGQMSDEKNKAGEALRQCAAIHEEISAYHGGDGLVERYDRSREHEPSPMLPLPALMKRLRDDRERVSALAARGRAELATLYALGTRRTDYGRGLGSRYLSWYVDKKTPRQFEHFVAGVAEKEGHRIARRTGGPEDDGADTIAELSDGRRAVFQTKFRSDGGTVDKRHIQVVNGTARQVHGADVAIVVTNGFFTKPAARFAFNHDIHLLDRELLRRWATGDRLADLLTRQHVGWHPTP